MPVFWTNGSLMNVHIENLQESVTANVDKIRIKEDLLASAEGLIKGRKASYLNWGLVLTAAAVRALSILYIYRT